MAYANLKAEIVRKGYSIADFAKLANFSTASLKRKLKCETQFTVRDVMKIRAFFPDCSIDYLFKL